MEDAGKPRFDPEAAWQRIKDNRDRLDACPRHLFEPFPLEAVRLGAKVECLTCGGLMDLTALNYYIRGYEAAGKTGNDILPGWKEEPGKDDEPIKRTFFADDPE
jgi:hypothetical protein